ncbi:MAG: hypothetical protein HY593_05525 [Candidatus Omnitrophica bacterium]|nr:hypothetical protein [Candidatus Omnitrophota bacterium]
MIRKMGNVMGKNRVCLFFDRSYVDAHFCFREMVKEFVKKGWEVDLYTEFCHSQTTPCFASKNVRVFFIQKSKIHVFLLLLRLVFRRRYRLIVATPPWALYWAVWAGKFRKAPVICLSDEIYSWDQILYLSEGRASPSLVKWNKKEKWAHGRCALTVSLSESRFQFIKEKNAISDRHPYVVIPNAPAGEGKKLRSSFYRDTLDIPEHHVILLHAGSLDWSFTKPLVQAAFGWDYPLSLVFQVRMRGVDLGMDIPPNVRFSQAILPGEMVRYAASSADIGLMLYSRTNFIESVNGATAGKLGLYLSCGLPIICSNLDSLRWVEEEGCGVWVPDVGMVETAVEKIRASYKMYSENAIRVFNKKYEYSRRFEVFFEKLNEIRNGDRDERRQLQGLWKSEAF